MCFASHPPGVVAVGHAGYGRKGEDIVCAALSTLLFTVPAALKRIGVPMRFESGSGFFLAEAMPAPEQEKSAELVFSTIRAMVEILSKQYPDNLRIS